MVRDNSSKVREKINLRTYLKNLKNEVSNKTFKIIIYFILLQTQYASNHRKKLKDSKIYKTLSEAFQFTPRYIRS